MNTLNLIGSVSTTKAKLHKLSTINRKPRYCLLGNPLIKQMKDIGPFFREGELKQNKARSEGAFSSTESKKSVRAIL